MEREDGFLFEGVDVVVDVVSPLLEGLAGGEDWGAIGEVPLPVFMAGALAAEGAFDEAFFKGAEEALEDVLLSITERTRREIGGEGVEDFPEGSGGRWEDHGKARRSRE